MDAYALKPDSLISDLVERAQASSAPVAVMEGPDECLVAMRPEVFEELLLGSLLLDCVDRGALLP